MKTVNLKGKLIFETESELQDYIQNLPVITGKRLSELKRWLSADDSMTIDDVREIDGFVYVFEAQLGEPAQWRIAQTRPHMDKYTDNNLLFVRPDVDYRFWIESDQNEVCDCTEETMEQYGCQCDSWIAYDEEFFENFEAEYPALGFVSGDCRACKYEITGSEIIKNPDVLDIDDLVEKILAVMNGQPTH